MSAERRRRHALRRVAAWAMPAALAFLALPFPARGQLGFDPAGIDAVFADFGATTPGCAVGVVRGGVLVFGRGYGMANLEHGIPITTRSVFRTGSVSKQFTGAVVAIASLDGHVSLEDPLRKWIPELPDYGSPLTLLHALNHTSGLRDYLTLMRLRGLRGSDYYTGEELIAVQAAQAELNFDPGAEYLYSNSGYYLLTEAIARAVGRPFKEYAEEVLFGPLGMSNSHFHDDHDHIVPLRADGYAPLPGGGFRTSMTTLDMIGDGGVYSSVEDMALWLAALERDGLRGGLTPMLETRGLLRSGDEIDYAMGQVHGAYRGLPTVGHGGSFVGFRAQTLRFPTEGVSLVTLCNRADAAPSPRTLRVADVVLADRLGPEPRPSAQARNDPEGTPALAVDDAARYVGVYHSEELGVDYTFEIRDGALGVRAGAGIDGTVYRLEGDTLAMGPARGPDRFAPSLVFRFEREASGVTGFELDAGRVAHVRFRRVRP